ncbi:MAG: site-2 protease family protein [Candidatus Aenigmarchaeota archaeon]|nr:site-2 protease family protein [Candidatus Aenigmarchaeota archaeon]
MLYTISIIVFFTLIIMLLYKYRKKIEIKYYIFYSFKTSKFKKTIDNIAQKHLKLWKILSTIAVIICLLAMIFGVISIAKLAYNIGTGIQKEPALSLVLPSLTQETVFGNGYILIPFWFWIIIIASILIPHELSHGIISRAEKIKLKSVGVFLLAIFPGAFVEPDERQLKKSKIITKLRVFAAGSAANFLVSIIVFLLLTFLIWPACTSQGIEVILVNETSPAADAGLKPGMILTHINSIPIKTSYIEYSKYGTYYQLYDEIGIPKDNETIVFTDSNENNYNVTVKEISNNKIFIGMASKPITNINSNFFFKTLIPLLTYLYLFSFGIGLFNILPIYPLDGGLMIEEIINKISKKHGKIISKIISNLMILLILYTFIMPHLL